MAAVNPTSFLTLTEQEYETVQDLWRQRRDSRACLSERFVAIESAMLPLLAIRLVCSTDQVPFPYRDQVAHAVFGCALDEPELRGSLLGEMASAIYYDGGGSLSLQA